MKELDLKLNLEGVKESEGLNKTKIDKQMSVALSEAQAKSLSK